MPGNLRTYAFTVYGWTATDVEHTYARPNRVPREIFDSIPMPYFILLCFARVRHDPHGLQTFVHPHLMNILIEDERSGSSIRHCRLIVLMSDDSGDFRTKDRALYAIPASAISIEHTSNVPHARWLPLKLKKKPWSLRKYRLSGTEDLLQLVLKRAFEKFQLSARQDQAYIKFGDGHIRLVSRDDLFKLVDEQRGSQGSEKHGDNITVL